MKTYDLEDTGRGGYEPHYQLVESVNHKKEPDGQGDWVRREDADALAADLSATDKERANLFGLNQRQRSRIAQLEAELAELQKLVPLKGGIPLKQYVQQERIRTLEAALREAIEWDWIEPEGIPEVSMKFVMSALGEPLPARPTLALPAQAASPFDSDDVPRGTSETVEVMPPDEAAEVRRSAQETKGEGQ